MQDKIFIVHSLPGEGKTLNADMLSDWLQCAHIVEEVDASPWIRFGWVKAGTGNWLILALTGGKAVTNEGRLRSKFAKLLESKNVFVHVHELSSLLAIAETTGQKVKRP